MALLAVFASCVFLSGSVSAAPGKRPDGYLDWRTFKGNGANLGGWLVQEPQIDTFWWADNCGEAVDEWTCCAKLGTQCAPVFESRYETWITTDDIDLLATGDIQVIRVPTTYAAWIEVPGSQLYHGNQQAHISRIANHAIEKYDMHVILDIHGLPGGVNNGTIGERVGGLDWFYNETALDYSLQAVDAIISFIQESGHPGSYTIEPINEPQDNPADIGFPSSLSEPAAAWLVKYIKAAIARVEAVNAHIPVMFQGSFSPPEYWSPNFPSTNTNMVFDVHAYYFTGRQVTSANITTLICSDAKAAAANGRFPVYIGEWSLQTAYENTLASRAANLNAGLHAWNKYEQGGAYWTAKYRANLTVDGEGTTSDYWSYETFVEMGMLDPGSVSPGYCE